MKTLILSVLVLSLTSCAVMPANEEPTLYRKGLPSDLITIVNPPEQKMVVTKEGGILHLKEVK